jgi:hypothetical protein
VPHVWKNRSLAIGLNDIAALQRLASRDFAVNRLQFPLA